MEEKASLCPDVREDITILPGAGVLVILLR